MKILLIAYTFDNSFAAGVVTARIANALADLGEELCIISSEKVGHKFDKGMHVICSSFPNRPAILFMQLGKWFKKNMTYYFWERRAYSAAKRIIKKWNPDVIYARATPVASCKVASKLTRISHLPVIMHFTDPWPSPIEWMPDLTQRKIYVDLMDSILPSASLVSFGNQRMLDFQLKSISYDFSKKAFVSPDPSPSTEFSYFPKFEHDTVTLVYLGKIHGNRNPQPLFKAVTALYDEGVKIELIIYDEGQSSSNIPFIKYVGRTNDVRSAVLSGDILIDLDGDDSEPVFISSKFKDYINYGRPILSITPQNSPVRELVEGMKTIFCINNDSETIKILIKDIKEISFTRCDYDERNRLRLMFQPNVIARDLLNRVKELTSK